jgi:hypothetical protein
MTNKNTINVPAESATVPIATPGDRRDPIAVEGTPGKIAKFRTSTAIQDSIITESEGRIGIGTDTPTATLTVNGPSGIGVHAQGGSDGVVGSSQVNTGVRGHGPFAGVFGISENGSGVRGESPSGNAVYGFSTGNIGVLGVIGSGGGSNAAGVLGISHGGATAVYGHSANGPGVIGFSNGPGVIGSSNGTAPGVYGDSRFGYAGYFRGNVHVTGGLSQGGGGIMIDHPLDPTHKTLTHACVESPDMLNIYNGNIITDAQGNATIMLPAYFQALNREFRYQLTVLEQFAQAIVSREIQENHFTIKTDKPHVKVSWMVTGVRQDAYANAHRIAVEDDKPAQEQGLYLHPEAYGQPPTKGVHQPPQLGELPPLNAAVARQL